MINWTEHIWAKPWYRAFQFWGAWLTWLLLVVANSIRLARYPCGKAWAWAFIVAQVCAVLACGAGFILMHRRIQNVLAGSDDDRQRRVLELVTQLFYQTVGGLVSTLVIMVLAQGIPDLC